MFKTQWRTSKPFEILQICRTHTFIKSKGSVVMCFRFSESRMDILGIPSPPYTQAPNPPSPIPPPPYPDIRGVCVWINAYQYLSILTINRHRLTHSSSILVNGLMNGQPDKSFLRAETEVVSTCKQIQEIITESFLLNNCWVFTVILIKYILPIYNIQTVYRQHVFGNCVMFNWCQIIAFIIDDQLLIMIIFNIKDEKSFSA